MKRCPLCNDEFDDRRVFCTNDGVTLKTVDGTDTLVGRILDGKYVIEEHVGRGGMGSVYRARHLLIGDDVAIKVLRPEMSQSEDAVERLRREAKAARHLRNAHTISVIDFSATEDGLVYLVMEFVRGVSLRNVLKEAGRLDPRRAAAIITQIAEGLDHAHAVGVVHRDLKPDNVMLEREGGRPDFVRVLDFGIAKLSSGDTKLRTLTNEDVILGTPCYLSPEQCGAGPVGPRSDVYSLGVMLYEMVAGDVPFDGSSALDVARQHLFAKPKPPRERNPNLPERVEAVILKALEKEPEARYGSAGELAADLAGAVAELDANDLVPTLDVARGKLEASLAPTTAGVKRTTSPDPKARPTGEGDEAAEKQAPEPAAPVRSRRVSRARLAIVGLAVVGVVVAAVLLVPRHTDPTPADPYADMVPIPAGPFAMGSETKREDCQDEHPVHVVDLPAFYLDRTEVTNAQYKAFCDATRRDYPPSPGWDPTYFLSKPDYPVINVAWKDAQDYAKWTGKRLPTEAEWEKAARGTDGRTYPWGNDLREGVTTVAGTSDGFEYTAPVGSFPAGASPYGCLDMTGNVFEWTEDWYQPYPGSNGSWDKHGDTGFKKRVIRGGSFTARPEVVDAAGGVARTSERFCEAPDYRSVNLGFRCAKTP